MVFLQEVPDIQFNLLMVCYFSLINLNNSNPTEVYFVLMLCCKTIVQGYGDGCPFMVNKLIFKMICLSQVDTGYS